MGINIERQSVLQASLLVVYDLFFNQVSFNNRMHIVEQNDIDRRYVILDLPVTSLCAVD